MLLAALLLPYAVLSSSCKNGPEVTPCAVDSKRGGYQCVHGERDKIGFFVEFGQSGDLKCVSPRDLENYLKACRAGKVLKVTLCEFQAGGFVCTPPTGEIFGLTPEKADKYMCFSEKDRDRIEDRCEKD